MTTTTTITKRDLGRYISIITANQYGDASAPGAQTYYVISRLYPDGFTSVYDRFLQASAAAPPTHR